MSRPRLGSRWRTFEAWVGSRNSAVVLLAAGLAVYAIQSAFLPAYPGRDMSRYLQAFVQLGYDVPVYPAVLNTRGPLAALGVGVPLELGGWAAEVWLALLYAASIVAWARVAFVFGARAAVLTSVLLLVYPGYGILFHQLASDALFAAAFAGWAVLFARAARRPSVGRFLLVGIGIGALVLVRPANQVLLVTAALPLLLRAPRRDRLAWLAASFAPAVAVSQAWKVLAELRWGGAVALEPSTGLIGVALVLALLLVPAPWRRRAAVALGIAVVAVVAVRGWPGQSPAQYAHGVKQNESNQFLFRAFEVDRIMAPDNGPASRRLARVVRRELLTREPYRSYGVDVREFFASGSDRVFGDLTGVANPADLAVATREAVRRHPGTLASGIGRTLWDHVARRPVYALVPAAAESGRSAQNGAQDHVVVNGRRLPKPSEGQPIPASAIGPALWTLGGPAREVWRSPTEHHFVFADPHDKARFDKLGRDVAGLFAEIPTRGGSASVVHRFNQASHAFPPLVVWLLIGLFALALRRPRNALVALAPAFAGLVVIVATSVVATAVAEYAAPVSPAFIVLAAAGLVGASAAPEPSWRTRLSELARPAGLAAGVIAAAWAAWHYGSLIHDYLSADGAPHDLLVFLRAAGHVLHGASPYTFQGDQTYAYPPLLALLVAPLHPLGLGAATLVWTVVSLAAVGAALWLLGVRDWRCYALAAVFPVTRSAVDLGTVGPLLLLAFAVAWRWRDELVRPALATGAAIALKLFVWPVAVWLALTRRLRAAVAGLAVAVLLGLLSWAVIGFAGIGDYPDLLRRLADDEASSSYSVVALGVRAHLPESVATVAAVVVAAALLFAAAAVARDDRRPTRERDVAVLSLALAAALAASPIVWVHYFLLLLVPLALARPRLSLLWLVPFAYEPLGESAWPAGDARKLGLALAATLVLLGAGVLGDARRIRGMRPAWPARHGRTPEHQHLGPVELPKP